MATKRAAKSTSSRKRAKPAAPAMPPAPSGLAERAPVEPTPAEPAPAVPEPAPAAPAARSLEAILFGRLFPPGHHEREVTARYLESVRWGDRYKPSLDELLRAKEVAASVVAAIVGGKEEQWKRLTEAWLVLNDLRTESKKIGRAVTVIDVLLYRSAAMPDDAGVERIAGKLRDELTLIDSTFEALKASDIARVLKDMAKDRPKDPEKYAKGGRRNRGARGALAYLCLMCGALGAKRLNPFLPTSKGELNRFRNTIPQHYKRSGRKPLKFNALLVPGVRHHYP